MCIAKERHQWFNGEHAHLENDVGFEPPSGQSKDYEIVFAASPLSTQN